MDRQGTPGKQCRWRLILCMRDLCALKAPSSRVRHVSLLLLSVPCLDGQVAHRTVAKTQLGPRTDVILSPKTGPAGKPGAAAELTPSTFCS